MARKLTKANVDARLAEVFKQATRIVALCVPITNNSTESPATKRDTMRIALRPALFILRKVGRRGDTRGLATRVHRRHGQH